jgi:hypothetical protein
VVNFETRTFYSRYTKLPTSIQQKLGCTLLPVWTLRRCEKPLVLVKNRNMCVRVPNLQAQSTIDLLLTPRSSALHEKLAGSQLVKNIPAFMEPEGSLPRFKCPPPVPILSQIYPVLVPRIPLPEDPYEQQSATVFKILRITAGS